MKRLICLLLVCFVGNLTFRVVGQISVTNEPVPGIRIHSEIQTNPPQRLFIAEVDLKNPKLHLHVSRGGPDPDGAGKWETTLMEPTKIAMREKFNFVVNGDFFKAKGVNDGEGTNAAFRAAQWALVEGPAMTAGMTWATASNARPCFVVHKDRSLIIDTLAQPPADALEVIAGNTILVRDGKVVPHKSKVRHPRTAVGLDATGNKLIFFVNDGRKPGVAVGMSYDELGAEMVRLGCTEALNLDGGGSSVMAVRPLNAEKFQILNAPTDGRERAVANVLGITVEP